uniref:Opsin 8, group member b n=1 Tax=Cynoglossus semilaevis TaxID=244447 RepID=A0A3P8UMY5_CYNSE
MDIYASTLSPALDIAVGCYLLVVAVLSIIGNLMVIIIAFKRSSRLKPPELLSVNLAVSDLGAALTMYPLSVASAWSHHWIGGDATCIYYGLAGFLFGLASIMNLTVLAMVRFIVSMNLQSMRDRISWKQAKILCAWTWLYALIWALFPIVGWGQYGPEPFGVSCSLAWGQMKHKGFSFVISIFSLNLALPSFIITCCYFGISIKLYLVYKNYTGGSIPVPNYVKLQQRLLIIAVLVTFGFLGCWFPYGMVSLWSIFNESSAIPPEVSLLPCMFAKSSTVYNPMIYYIFSKNFQRELKELQMRCLGFYFCKSNSAKEDITFISKLDRRSNTAALSQRCLETTDLG